MTLAQHALRYSKCSTAELRGFIKRRTGYKPNTGRSRTRRFFMGYLRNLDRVCYFPRFLDLPAELRVTIYEYLFANGVIHTAILWTCKLIKKEAESVLYSSRVFTIWLSGYMHSEPALTSMVVSGDALRPYFIGSRQESPGNIEALSTSRLTAHWRHIRHLEIWIELRDWTDGSEDAHLAAAWEMLNTMLGGIVGQTITKRDLISVKVHVSLQDETLQRLQEGCASLARLVSLKGRGVEVAIEGIPENFFVPQLRPSTSQGTERAL
jgi:hypothetical protein